MTPMRSRIKKWLSNALIKAASNISTKVNFLNLPATKIKALIDEPVENQTLSDVLIVKGWAFSTEGSILKIEAFIDKVSLGPVLGGFERPDVKEAFPNNAGTFKSGFITSFSLANISPGPYKLRIRITDNTLTVRELIKSINKEASDMEMFVETPVEDSVLSDIVKVSGWVFAKSSSIEKIEGFLNEEPTGVFRYGHIRLDVTSARPGERITANCGFTANLDLTNITTGGPKTLTIRATDTKGKQIQKTLSVKTEPSKTRFVLENPRIGSVSAGTLNVTGWIINMPGEIEKLEVFLNNKYIGRLKYGVFRPDVIAVYKPVTEINCGFTGWLEFPVQEPGFQQLKVRAIDVRGFSLEREVEIELRLPGEALAEIDKAIWCNNILEVEGWAFLPTKHPPVFARIFINNTFVGETRVGYSRPDVWQRFRTRSDSATSGFKVKYEFNEPVDANPLKDLYKLTIEIVDGEGRQHRCETHLKHERRPMQDMEPFHWDEIIVEYQQYFGESPTILDWFTQSNLAGILPDQTVFSPSVDNECNKLPYIDKSIDLVVLNSSYPNRLAEARRIASKGIINLANIADFNPYPGKPTYARRNPFEIEWFDFYPNQQRFKHLPSCSIIIPTYNGAELVNNCLNKLIETVSDHLEVEFLVIDDASTDNTSQLAEKWLTLDSRIRFHRNLQNLGFLRSSNRGAELAKGEVIIFLNNDTLPQPGWLTPLLKTLKDHPEAGAVGGKLIYPDGLLQEAGGIIFSDGEGWNFGRNDYKINTPIYSFFREVDYCSGALLATWRNLFLENGGFDKLFVPMYYEDVDYCFSLRAKGKKVYYQPESVVIHLEGGTAGTDLTKGFKTYQSINLKKFINKWSNELKRQPFHPDRIDMMTNFDLVVRSEKESQPEATDAVSVSKTKAVTEKDDR